MTSEEITRNEPDLARTTKLHEQQVLTLRFVGENEAENELHELRAEHVSDVLEGLSELTQDFDKAGAFHNSGPSPRDLFVRPAREGSFIIEVVQMLSDNQDTAKTMGVPSIGAIVWWATQKAKDQVKYFDYLENGNVRVEWRDGSADELTPEVWEELNKRNRRRRKQLRKILRPMEDARVNRLEAKGTADANQQPVTFTRTDYKAVEPRDPEEETYDIFDIAGQLSAIDFDDPDRWKIKTNIATRVATVEDEKFLEDVANGLQLSATDTYDLTIREDRITKNGRTTTKWTILKIQKEGESNENGLIDSGSDVSDRS